MLLTYLVIKLNPKYAAQKIKKKKKWRQVITVNFGPNSNSLRIFILFNYLLS